MSEGHKFNNFDIAYYDFPGEKIMEDYIAEGGNAQLLI